MESKRKKRRVHKETRQTLDQNALPRANSKSVRPTTAESLINLNGILVEELFLSQVWTEIVFPLIQESIAGVSGRLTNNKFIQGSFTRPNNTVSLEYLSGYQAALEQLHNNLQEFVSEKQNLLEKKLQEQTEAEAPVYNPFMEDLNEETN